MSTWLIAYEIANAEKLAHFEYELKNVYEACQIQKTLWMMEHPGDVSYIMGHFRFIIEENDKLWVSEVIRTFAKGQDHPHYEFHNTIDQVQTWLNTYPPQKYFLA